MSMDPPYTHTISESPFNLAALGLTLLCPRSWFPCPSWWLCCWGNEGTETRNVTAMQLSCPFRSGKRRRESIMLSFQWKLLFWPFCYLCPFSRTWRAWSIGHSPTLCDLFCLTELRKWDIEQLSQYLGGTEIRQEPGSPVISVLACCFSDTSF